jgi:hypothetical protein
MIATSAIPSVEPNQPSQVDHPKIETFLSRKDDKGNSTLPLEEGAENQRNDVCHLFGQLFLGSFQLFFISVSSVVTGTSGRG